MQYLNKKKTTQGKKAKEWNDARDKLKRIFMQKGITFCEQCGSQDALSFAHSLKRRHIVGSEIYEVAVLCIPCHQKVEQKTEHEMSEIIRSIIKQRGWCASELIVTE